MKPSHVMQNFDYKRRELIKQIDQAKREGRKLLFLDEINSLSPRSQAKLLRFLENGEYRPVGTDSTRRSPAWIMTASNEDLSARVRGGDFRADLFYRLQVLVVQLPALRQRGADVMKLARHFKDLANGASLSFSAAAERALLEAHRSQRAVEACRA